MIIKQLIVYYILGINILAAVICIIDKNRAIKGKWRISEKVLFAVSAIGGAAGMYVTMLFIRHKTLHKRFMLGLPLIIAIHFYLFIKFFS